MIKMASRCSGQDRPNASNRRRISLRPIPASIRRVVRSVSSNVALPVLPEARIEMRNEMRSPSAREFGDGKDIGRAEGQRQEPDAGMDAKDGGESARYSSYALISRIFRM